MNDSKKIIGLCVALLLLAACTPKPAVSVDPVKPTVTAPAATPTATLSAQPTTPAPVVASPPPTRSPIPTATQPPAPRSTWDGNLDALTLDDFPTELLEYGTQTSDDTALYLLAELPEQETYLYGMADGQSLILRVADAWQYFALPYLTPSGILPQMSYGDFDGDLNLELALQLYTGSGTGVSVWDLYVVEFGDGGVWTDHWFNPQDYNAILDASLTCAYDAATNIATLSVGGEGFPVDLSALGYAAPAAPITAFAGPIVAFAVSGDGITGSFAVGLSGPDFPVTPLYSATIVATVVYTGSAFGLSDFKLTAMP